MNPEEINAVRRERNLPLEPTDSGSEETLEQKIEAQKDKGQQSVKKRPHEEAIPKTELINFRITNDDLGAGGPKQKFRANMEAVRLLHQLEFEERMATPEEQEVLSRYVGWGGLSQAFEENSKDWSEEFTEL